jgi:hypothetical protein
MHNIQIIDDISIIKRLNRVSSCILSLNGSTMILGYMIDNQIVSYVYFKLFYNSYITPLNKTCNYIHIIYSYTYEKYRSHGYNKKIRENMESIAKSLYMDYIISIPFDGANSKYLLQKLNYNNLSYNNCHIYYKEFIYVL